jgi:hypothetical protein
VGEIVGLGIGKPVRLDQGQVRPLVAGEGTGCGPDDAEDEQNHFADLKKAYEGEG